MNHEERVCKSRTLSAHKLFSGFYKPGNHIQADLNDKQEVIEVHLGWYLTAAEDKESLKIIVLALTYSNTLHTLCFGTEWYSVMYEENTMCDGMELYSIMMNSGN